MANADRIATVAAPLPPSIRPIPAALSRTEIVVPSRPVQIEIEIHTDWPAVLATLAVGCAVAYFAWASQRSQIKSSTAGYRHAWLEALRKAVLDFISATSEINYKIAQDSGFAKRPESDAIFRQLVTAQGTILLMLDKKKGYTAEITMSMDRIRDAIRSGCEDRIDAGVVDFTNKAQDVLERAWKDIRRDLHSDQSLFDRVVGLARGQKWTSRSGGTDPAPPLAVGGSAAGDSV